MSKKIVFTIGKILISIFLIYYLFYNININEVVALLRKINLQNLIWAGITSIFLKQIFFVLRWQAILRYNDINISFIKNVKYHYVSMMFQTFLPSGIGADAAKAALTLKYGKKSGAINSVLISRGVGVFVLFLYAFVGSIFTNIEKAVNLRMPLFFIIISFLLFFFLLKNNRFYSYISSLKIINKFKKLGYLLKNFKFNMDIKLLAILFFYSVLIQFFSIISFWFAVSSVNVYIPIIDVMIFFPIITVLVIIIPSINGIGAREYLILYFFGKYIINKEILGSVSIVTYFLFFLTAFIGLIYWIYSIIFDRK